MATQIFIFLVLRIVSRHALQFILFPADIGFAVLWNPNFVVFSCDGFERVMILENEI